ncbi:enoyl-CoA hydratase/isomerase family protein [bacterium]|nr:enoyl-CoA hydratase/isomerase family protein [bacterium]
MSFETLLVEINEGIATVQVNRPKALNAINRQVLIDLGNAFKQLEGDSNVKGIILTGNGDKAFVAGADIVSMQNMTVLEATEFGKLGHDTMKTIENCGKPVVAAVNGFALGGGLELALSCDFIYASSTAKLGLPEVNLGIFPGFGGTQRLSRLIGKNRAKELVYTAKIISAEEGLNIGIVNKVSAPETLLADVKATLSTILTKGLVAIRLAKKVMNEGTDLDLASGLAMEENTFPLTFSTDDKKEGVAAFIEKRKANFTGK